MPPTDETSDPKPPVTLDQPPTPLVMPAGVTVAQTPNVQARVAAALAPNTPPQLSISGYEIIRKIGEGGMGVVYLARELQLGREVALKMIRADRPITPEVVARFAREAHITALLPHPNIPPVHALGHLPDGRPYLVMKLVRGRTLADLLDEQSSASENIHTSLQIFLQVCHAIAFAHSQGVLHRDLKPANIMVGQFGEVQVMDWGLAKQLLSLDDESAPAGTEEADPALTHTGVVIGTPAYMAPEQARGELHAIGKRTDVFALGAMLCVILTGHPPFSGPRAAVMARCALGQMGEAHHWLAASRAPAELIELARACLSPNPADRPADADAVADAVRSHMEMAQDWERRIELAQTVIRDRLALTSHGRLIRWALITSGALVSFGWGVVLLASQYLESHVRFGGIVLMIPALALLFTGVALLLTRNIYGAPNLYRRPVPRSRSYRNEDQVDSFTGTEQTSPEPPPEVATPLNQSRPYRARQGPGWVQRNLLHCVFGLLGFGTCTGLPLLALLGVNKVPTLGGGANGKSPGESGEEEQWREVRLRNLHGGEAVVFYTGRVLHEESLRVGHFIRERDSFGGSGGASVVLDKQSGVWVLSYFSTSGSKLRPDERVEFETFRRELSARTFGGEPVVIQICRQFVREGNARTLDVIDRFE